MRYFFVVFLAKKMRGQPPEENVEPLDWPPVIGLTVPYYESVTGNNFIASDGPFVVSNFQASAESRSLREVCVTSFTEVDEETYLAN